MFFFKTVLSVLSTRFFEKFIRQINSIIIGRTIGPSGLGLFTLFFTLVKNFHTISEFGLGASGIFFIKRKKENTRKIIENAFFFSLFMGLFFFIIIFFLRQKIANYLLDDSSIYIFLISIVIPFITVSAIFSSLLRGLDRFKDFNIFTLMKPLFFFIFIFFSLIIYDGNVTSAIIGQVSAILFVGIWLVIKVHKMIPFKINFHYDTFLENIKYGIKHHIMKIILMFMVTAPIYILKMLTSADIVGQYSIILSLLGLVGFIKMSISLVLTPKAAEFNGHEVHRFIAKISRHTFYITIVSSIITLFLGSFYISILYGSEFDYASQAFVWYLPGLIFHSVSIMIHRDFIVRENPILHIPIIAYSIGALISILSSYIFIYNNLDKPLEAFALAYNLAYFSSFLILVIVFLKDTNQKFVNLFILKSSDIDDYKKVISLAFNKLK